MKAAALVAILLCAACGTPAPTELSYTLRMDVRDGPIAATPVDPALAAMGAEVLEMMVPGGSVVINVITGPRGTRLGVSKAISGLPAGAMMLHRPDGSIVTLDPASRTYWKSPSADTGGGQANTKPTGSFTTLNDERVERVTFRMGFPSVDGANPASAQAVVEGEAWIASRFKKYTAVRSAAPAGGLGLFQLADLGLSMRQIMRSPMFSGREIEANVIRLREERADASLFEIPAGYKEVGMPAASGS